MRRIKRGMREMAKLTGREILAHYGYEGEGYGVIEEGTCVGIFPKDGNSIFPPAIERLRNLPEILQGDYCGEKKLRVTFDYDPEFPYAVLQISGLYSDEWIERIDNLAHSEINRVQNPAHQ